MVKFPVYFLHLWLPKAHVEAPTVARMLLAGLLLKLGCVGFVRVIGSIGFYRVFFWLFLSFLGMVVSSLSCVFQRDVKSLAAYSSVVHMRMFLMVLVRMCIIGKGAGFLMLLGHGFTSAILFYLIGVFYSCTSSRVVYYFVGFFGGGLFFVFLLCLVFISNIGVPPSLSFFSEFLAVGSMYYGFLLGFVVLGVYLFLSFYYSVYIISIGLIGFSFFCFEVFSLGLCVPFLLIMYNVFWLVIFFCGFKLSLNC